MHKLKIIFKLISERIGIMFRTNMKYENVTPQKFKEIQESDEKAIVIDCRTKAEVEMGALEYDLHLDLMNPSIKTTIDELDKNKAYIVYCRSGSRSASLCNYMASQGFEKLYNLAGGIMSYR
mgnify:FL=1